MMNKKKEFCVIIVSYRSHQGKIPFKQNLDRINGNYHRFKNHIQTTEVGIISAPCNKGHGALECVKGGG